MKLRWLFDFTSAHAISELQFHELISKIPFSPKFNLAIETDGSGGLDVGGGGTV